MKEHLVKIDRTFLRSKVARRIFLLFIVCALLPITALALLSYFRVKQQLEEQIQIRLHRSAKDAAVAINDRLKSLEADMTTIALSLKWVEGSPSVPSELAIQRFNAVSFVGSSGAVAVPLYNDMKPLPPLTDGEKKHLDLGRTLLSTRLDPKGAPQVFMRRAIRDVGSGSLFLAGEVRETYLWGDAVQGMAPPMAEMCILDDSGNILFTTLPAKEAFPPSVASEILKYHSGGIEWRYLDQEYLGRYWSIFTRYDFYVPRWIVLMGESRAHVLAPMADFKKTFPLVILLSLWVVLLLSLYQIRRSLDPLERLKEGTRRIAAADFSTRVTVTSGDEFEDLAKSFNTMAARLGKQFDAMTAMNEIDRSILSALDKEKIVNTVITRMGDLFPCETIGLALFQSGENHEGFLHMNTDLSGEQTALEPVRLVPSEVQTLQDNPEYVRIETGKEPPAYLKALDQRHIQMFVVFPIFVRSGLSGFLALGYADRAVCSTEDCLHARQLSDQVAVALSNAKLIEDLEDLNWGTLYALARAIDAKSPWTAGHSERVTALALKIGLAMGLGRKALDDLHRAGLLHDIGKLGIPPHILDKPEGLTDDEFHMMRKHTRFGAKILEPIPSYASVVPIVLHHHENFDGTGYPDGLAGARIPFGARIFAVADQYDALISDRPYHAGAKREEVVEIIRQSAGSRFDPAVVQAFLQVMEQEESKLPS